VSLHHSPARKRRAAPAVDLEKSPWTIREVAAFFGGSKPLHPATVYRGVKEGRIPPPYHPSPGIARWDPSACRAAQAKMIAETDETASER
jgi:predicted DNA-binding transcriptional regulator AlpA